MIRDKNSKHNVGGWDDGWFSVSLVDRICLSVLGPTQSGNRTRLYKTPTLSTRSRVWGNEVQESSLLLPHESRPHFPLPPVSTAVFPLSTCLLPTLRQASCRFDGLTETLRAQVQTY